MLIRAILITLTLTIVWQLIVMTFQLPSYILPTPVAVLSVLIKQFPLLLQQAVPTVIETLLGLLLGTVLGIIGALSLIYFRPARQWFLPLLIISQALPTFAIAPLLVLWLGYGMASKIAVTILMLFFPVTSSFYDGLRRTPIAYLEMAKIAHTSKVRMLWYLQIPAALPALASGLRMAAVYAPMGAVIGEWVGASRGLGFIMLNANARMQVSTMFAALLMIIVFTLMLYFIIDRMLKKFIWWKN